MESIVLAVINVNNVRLPIQSGKIAKQEQSQMMSLCKVLRECISSGSNVIVGKNKFKAPYSL